MSQQNPAQTVNTMQRELTECLAQKALLDEKIVALRNALQGAALGVELQKAAAAEAVPTE